MISFKGKFALVILSEVGRKAEQRVLSIIRISSNKWLSLGTTIKSTSRDNNWEVKSFSISWLDQFRRNFWSPPRPLIHFIKAFIVPVDTIQSFMSDVDLVWSTYLAKTQTQNLIVIPAQIPALNPNIKSDLYHNPNHDQLTVGNYLDR